MFPINSAKRREAGKVKVEMLLLAGMGEPGRFAPDDLRFLMSNITIAVKVMGHNQLSTSLIGTRRNELSIEDAVRGFLEGITDGFDRTGAIVHALPAGEQSIQNTVSQPLHVLLVETDRAKSLKIQEAFERVRDEGSIARMRLEVTRGQDVPD